jgi:hypothetical protein
VRSGWRSRKRTHAREGAGEVGEERVASLQAQHEPAAAATDGAGDGDEAEAQPLGVARPFALGESEQL